MAILYGHTLNYPFVFDTKAHILENSQIESFFPWPNNLTQTRLLLHFTFALNYRLGGFEVSGYRILNLLIHLCSALVLFGILRHAIRKSFSPELDARRIDCLAFLISLLWLCHPLQTQSITYVVQRSEALASLFYLLALFLFIEGAEANKQRWVCYFASILAFDAGVLTKEIILTAPFLIFIYDRVFISASWKQALKQSGLYYASLLSAALFWVVLIKSTKSLYPASAGFEMEGSTSWQYLITQAGVILHYLKLAVWPVNLCLDYGWPIAQNLKAEWQPCLIMAFILAVVLFLFKKKSKTGFWIIWFFIILAPTSSVIPIQDAAVEHRMYLPLAGLLACGVILLYRLMRGISEVFAERVIVSLCIVFILLAGFLTVRRNSDYQSERQIWIDTFKKRPQNFRAAIALGHLAIEKGQTEEAEYYYQLVLRSDSKDLRAISYAHFGFANVLFQRKEYEEAEIHYREALEIDPMLFQAHHNLGATLAALGNMRGAVRAYNRALNIKPDFAIAKKNLSLAEKEVTAMK